MSSESDGAPQRRAPTIDLKATEIETPPQNAGTPQPDESAAQPVSAAQETSVQDSSAQGSSVPHVPPRNSSAQTSSSQDSVSQDSVSQHALNQGSSNQGSSNQGASDQAAGARTASAPRRPSAAWNFFGAAAGTLAAAAAVLTGLYVAGINPLQQNAPPPPPPPIGDAAANARISSQLAGIEARLRSQPTRPSDPTLAARLEQTEADTKTLNDQLAARLAKAEAETKTLSDQLAAVNQRLDGIAVAAQGARQHADEAAAAAKDATRQAVQPGDLDALAGRVAALERATKSLSERTARRPAPTSDRVARGALATAALRAAVERGAPFTAELATVKAFGADRGAVAVLAPFAATGIPSAADLAGELSRLAAPLKQASGTRPPAASFLGRIEDNAKNLVHVTAADAPPGNAPDAVIGRLDADARRTDLAAALADVAHLPPAARSLAAPWVQKVNARNEAIAASRHIAAGALGALATAKTQ